MGYSAEEAAEVVRNELADSVAFGTAFLANPDLPARIKAGAALNTPDPDTFYTACAEGYTGYPFMSA
jgi:N-ethylmaleimide reductase